MVDTHNLSDGKKKYFCDLCEKNFDTIQDAVSHEKSCTSVGGRNYADWTVHQLKWTLKEKGLPVSGKKHALIERLESSEGLGGSEQLSCDFCGKKFKSKNKLFDHLKKFPGHSPEEKNYLGEGTLDAKDKSIVEQIMEKYRAPDYKYKAPFKREKRPYPLILSIAIIALYFIGLSVPYLIYSGTYVITDNWISYFIATVLFLILYFYIQSENIEMDLIPQEIPPVVNYLTAIGVLLVITALYFLASNDASNEGVVFTCCSSLILLLIPVALFPMEDVDERLRRRRKSEHDKREEDKRQIKWSEACKLEEGGWFDAATKIWLEFNEEREIERVARMKAECLCVLLKRRIKDLTKQGTNCKQLEEQLAKIEAALEVSTARLEFVSIEDEEESLTVADSTVTSSPDINLKKKTDISLEEIEEEPHTLSSDMTEVDNDIVVNRSSIGADEDDKFMKLKELTEMKEKGLIDDDEFKQMKKEILG